MIRHKHFISVDELWKFIRDSAPSDVYYSTAYYSKPEAEMEKKGWLGADLVFDIDADHLSTTCKKEHDRWTCKTCEKSGKGPAPYVCPSCSSERFNEYTWICELCLQEAKKEVIKLIEFLLEDFGFSKNDLRVFFTGHRGYHVHVLSDTIFSMNSDERKEITDYILGTGLDADFILGDSLVNILSELDTAKGWKRRIIRKFVDIFTDINKYELKNLGFSNILIQKIVTDKAQSGLPDALDIIQDLEVQIKNSKRWKIITKKIVESCSAGIDTVVTTDIHRLIRVNETLNGKTGLRTVEVEISDLESFDPLISSIGIKKGQETIEVYEAPKFRIGNSTFGPYKEQRVTLPTAAAVMLVSKRKARPVK